MTSEPRPKASGPLCERLGHAFVDGRLLELALTHRSLGGANNERLEFLGDAVLGFLVAEALYARFPDAAEGELTRWRASLVRRESLAGIARDIGLGDVLRLGPGELKSGGRNRDSILANGLEALLGALFLDAGVDATRRSVLGIYGARIDEVRATATLKDAKTRLQEVLQAAGLALPVYEVERVEGEAHKQHFIVNCQISLLGKSVQGTGSSRRRAEQASAQGAIDALESANLLRDGLVAVPGPARTNA